MLAEKGARLTECYLLSAENSTWRLVTESYTAGGQDLKFPQIRRKTGLQVTELKGREIFEVRQPTPGRLHDLHDAFHGISSI